MASCTHANDDGTECDRPAMEGWGVCTAHWRTVLTKPGSGHLARIAADMKWSAKREEDAGEAR